MDTKPKDTRNKLDSDIEINIKNFGNDIPVG